MPKLGYMYNQRQDNERAFTYYKKATEKGNPNFRINNLIQNDIQ